MRLLVAFAVIASLAAQEPGFQTESRLVMVPAFVTNAKGRNMDALTASDFVLLDNGRKQTIVLDTFETGNAPIALIVAVQSSGISVPVLEKVRKIGAMIQPLITGDRGCAGLVSFAEKVQWRQECTNDVEKLASAFDKLAPGENKSACMLDAAHEAIERLRKRPNARRVLLLISESKDRGSETELETVVINAQAAGVTVYAATYSAFKTAFTTKSSQNDPPPEPLYPRANRTETLTPKGRVPIPLSEQRVDFLGGMGELIRLGKAKDTDALTKATGGTNFPFARLKGLESAIEKLGSELHTQYILSFTPVSPEPGFHTLEVLVPGKKEAKIRSRPAYWSVSVPQGGA